MTYAWATWMLDALRSDPVVAPKILEVPDWQTRGRPPSQFSFFPSGLLEHHTACMCRIGHDPQSCLNTIVSGYGSTPGPISQLLGTFTKPGTRWTGTNFDPHIIIVAAGRANHAGAGEYSWGAPGGNGSSIGIEWCGPVAYWPDRIIEFRARVSAALLRNRSWGTHQVDTHFSYARPVGRKIDVSGAYASEPQLGLTEPWAQEIWRDEIDKYLYPSAPEPPIIIPPDPPTTPTPIQENDEMLFIAKPTFPGATDATPWIVYYANPGNGPRGARAVGAHVEAAQLLGVPIVPMNSPEHHAYECALYGIQNP